jgi:hypothetical protein
VFIGIEKMRCGELGPKEAERFMSKVVIGHGPGSCWFWGSERTPLGYGSFCLRGARRRAARVAYSHFVGDIPGGLVLDHLCRNRSCVNPAHLEPVTQRENVLRGTGWAARNAKKTNCPTCGLPYAGENLLLDSGGRKCRACTYKRNREYSRRRYARAVTP